jgi:hypothetical protein
MNLETQRDRFRKRSGSVLISILGLLLVGSAAAKFVPQPASQMAALGFARGKLLLIVFLEAMSAILLMIPRSRAVGLLLGSAYLGGAIATHIGHDQFLASVRPAVVLAMLWTAVWLRNPEMLWSFDARGSMKNSGAQAAEFRRFAGEV